ncbi:hypothetical protein [Xanthomonas maliensis]|uniref:hypothetical protein n=1 Tax=Xanthomonas maliensis TaxID=1321368 RepID=UPI00039FC5DD|nr:hypothetical protein [Xanthomonas maliensis]KAB7765647.1 hypothetical protein CKY51_15145 [Xanthomonas maliensis]
MIRVQIDVSIPQETLSVDAAYDQLLGIAQRLQAVHPSFDGWVQHPRPGDRGPLPLSDRSGTIERLSRYAAQDAEAFPGMPHPGSAEATLTTAHVESQWLTPGRGLIKFQPGFGRVLFEIYRPVAAYGPADAPRIVQR